MGHAEVCDHHPAPVTAVLDHDVVGLDVAVNDPAGMSRGQRLGQGQRYECRHLWQEARLSLVQQSSQGGAFDQLGHDVARVFGRGVHEVVDLDDARVFERGHGVGFAAETFGPFASGRDRHAHDLDRYVATKLAIPGPKHGGHGPVAEHVQKQVAAERRAHSGAARRTRQARRPAGRGRRRRAGVERAGHGVLGGVPPAPPGLPRAACASLSF